MATAVAVAEPQGGVAAWPAARRPRVLLAPVTVTPTKPLTPSHLKFLLWVDVLYRATSHLADVTYRFSHTTYHPTEQTLGFWEYLDRTCGDDDYGSMSEVEVGELYVAYRSGGHRCSADDARPYAEAVEGGGWVHPVSARVLRLWSAHYEALGMHDPGLLVHQPPGLSLEEAIDHLARLGAVVDLRAHGGPVHLDATAAGLPLRQIVRPDGRPNYLACALRELLPLAPAYDEIVLAHDPELDADYRLLHHVLALSGTRVRRWSVGRVPVDGAVRSARHGDWRGNDAGTLIRAALAEQPAEAVRLGMRLYFIAALGPGSAQPLRHDLLHQYLLRAARLCREGVTGIGDLTDLLARHRGDGAHVDPYRLTTGQFGRKRPAPRRDLLTGVYL